MDQKYVFSVQCAGCLLPVDEALAKYVDNQPYCEKCCENEKEVANERNIILIHAPFNNLAWGSEWKPTDSLAAPLGLMYLGHPLKESGFKVTFLDLNTDQLELLEFQKLVTGNRFFLLETYSDSLENVVSLINEIRKVNPAAKILCGGPYPNLAKQHVSGSDVTFVGEAEEVIVDLVNKMAREESLNNFPGVIHVGEDGYETVSSVPFVENLDRTSHASSILAEGKKYGNFIGLQIDGIVGVMSSRGCPFRCIYCTHKGIIPYRKRSAESVVSELDELAKRGVKYVVFYDDNFMHDSNRVSDIMDLILARRIKIKMIVQGRVDSADLALYQKMKKAGVIVIMFGVENANQDILDFYRKGISIAKIEHAIRLANQVGIITFGWFIIGAPMESPEHLKRNAEFFRRVPLDWVNCNILGYYQGSPLWDDAVKRGLIAPHETVVYSNETLSPLSYQEWLDRKDELLKGFFANKRRLARLMLKSVRLGITSVFLKMVTAKNLTEKLRSPFVRVGEGKIIAN